MKLLLIAGGLTAVLLPAVLLGGAAAALTPSAPTPASAAGSGVAAPLGNIPPAYLTLYLQDASRCPGLSWTVLAAVGTVETNNGQNPDEVSSAGAVGPMQFEPTTWQRWGVDGDGDGIANPDDPADAIPAAADYLCASGARGGNNIPAALFAYNHSHTYVTAVLRIAGQLAAQAPDLTAQLDTTTGPAPSESTAMAAAAVTFALAQLGVPYEWGGDGPASGEGFDCSGLTQAAYAAAGVRLPRTAQAQYDATRPVPEGQPLEPGDLLFYGASLAAITHVGLYIGGGQMVDAPHTGADVRTEPYLWGDYLGASRPT